MVTFTEEIPNGKLHLLCSVYKNCLNVLCLTSRDWRTSTFRVIKEACLPHLFQYFTYCLKDKIKQKFAQISLYRISYKWHPKDFLEKFLCALHKKWSFSLRISSVNVTKSTGNCGFGSIHWRNSEKLHFLYSGVNVIPECFWASFCWQL